MKIKMLSNNKHETQREKKMKWNETSIAEISAGVWNMRCEHYIIIDALFLAIFFSFSSSLVHGNVYPLHSTKQSSSDYKWYKAMFLGFWFVLFFFCCWGLHVRFHLLQYTLKHEHRASKSKTQTHIHCSAHFQLADGGLEWSYQGQRYARKSHVCHGARELQRNQKKVIELWACAFFLSFSTNECCDSCDPNENERDT